ncbi:MAG TPA: DUF1579 family protein [Chloroflexota bacterium]
METLRRFHFDCQWTGKVRSNGMGPGSPDMEAVGNASYRPIMDGAWLVGDFEQDQFVESVRVITWKAHFVLGWDPRVREYRAAYVDNNGSSALLRGYIDGPRFVMEIVGDGTVRNRMQWELLDDGRVSWRNDCSIDSGPWFLVEEYVCTPLRQTSDMT